MGYSTGVWRLINDYFRREFKAFLAEEVQRNKYLVADPGGGIHGKSSPEPLVATMPGSEPKPSSGSVTANRLLDELIISFGRIFTTRNERELLAERPVTTQNQLADQPTLFTKPATRNAQENIPVQKQKNKPPNPKSSTPSAPPPPPGPGDPGGGDDGTTVVIGDKQTPTGVIAVGGDNEIWSTSSSSSSIDDDGDGSSDDDGEEKWLSYWRRKQSQVEDGDKTGLEADGAHCQAVQADDGCHP